MKCKCGCPLIKKIQGAKWCYSCKKILWCNRHRKERGAPLLPFPIYTSKDENENLVKDHFTWEKLQAYISKNNLRRYVEKLRQKTIEKLEQK